MNLLIEMFELATGIAEEEFALDPDGEAEEIGEEQSAVKRDALEVAMQDEAAPGSEKMQLVHQAETQRKENQRSDEDGVGEHWRQFPNAWSSWT